jgi:DNA-binding transcriptional regulator GbsR (MarR family)
MNRAGRRFADQMGHAAAADGLSPIAGRLFATLMLSDEPKSLDALADELGVSKASVSTDARRLFERGIVERVTVAGDRRDYYELAPDFFAQVIRARVGRWRRIQNLVGAMRESVPGLSPLVRQRFASIDEIQTSVVDRIDLALTEWERVAHRRAAAARSDAKPARRRRSA